jgi:hypothetical protein
MRDKIEAIGGRRFLLAAGAGLMTGLLQWFGKLDIQGTAYGLTIGATVAAYITGNVTQKIKEPRNEAIPPL